MPYLTCPSCGLPTYLVSTGDCPSCGAALKRRPPTGPRPATTPRDGEVHAKLAMACRELDVDSALLSEIARDREHVRWAAGEASYEGASVPLEESICKRLLEGTIGAVVTDAKRERALRGVPAVRDGSIGAYLGVPFRTEDARLYVLCCLAGEARPDLGAADLRFLQGVAESLRSLLEPSA